MPSLHTARAVSPGPTGHVRSSGGASEAELSMPRELGGAGGDIHVRLEVA